MSTSQLTLKIISTLAILMPIGFNVIKIKTTGRFGLLFLAFLTMGLATDLSLWYLYFHRHAGMILKIFNFYSLIEALFFFWLVRHLSSSPVLTSVAQKFLLAVVPFWIGGFFVYPLFIPGEASQSVPFDTVYEGAAAFLSGFGLLFLAEKERSLVRSWRFWLYLAVFFYCFCTFFIVSLLGSYLSLNLWPISNIVNILTYGLYSIGLWMKPAQETVFRTQDSVPPDKT